MNWLIVKNDFKRNKIINTALLLFMMFSACLSVLSAIMAVQTITSISDLVDAKEVIIVYCGYPNFLTLNRK